MIGKCRGNFFEGGGGSRDRTRKNAWNQKMEMMITVIEMTDELMAKLGIKN